VRLMAELTGIHGVKFYLKRTKPDLNSDLKWLSRFNIYSQ